MRLLGRGDGNTVLILTDAESRLLREWLTHCAMNDDPMGTENHPSGRCLRAFNAGIMRGTERIRAEAAELAKAKKAERK